MNACLEQNQKNYNALEIKYRSLSNENSILNEEKLRLEYELKQKTEASNKIIADLQSENENLQNALNEKQSVNKSLFNDNNNLFASLEAKTNENDIIVLHRLELEKYIAQLDQSISKTVKYSKKYLDIKQKEINAVKSENYIEANYLRSQADELEKEERELFYKNRTNKIENLVKKMKDQQEKERIALKQKFNREYEEIIAEKTNRLEYTRQNYLNKKKNLERNFNMTLNKKCI